jgi:hypothetical protein
MPAFSHQQRPAINRSYHQSRNTRSDSRHLALLQKSNSLFEDVSSAVLAFERIADPRPLPTVEIPIGTAAGRCVDSPLAEFEIEADEPMVVAP